MTFVKSAAHWLFFDDETVEPISEAMVQTAFGSPQVISFMSWSYMQYQMQTLVREQGHQALLSMCSLWHGQSSHFSQITLSLHICYK